MSHTKKLIGTITDKAVRSYLSPESDLIDVDNGKCGEGFKHWKQHWLATARQCRDELQAEGLADTVEALNKTIAFFEKVGGSD
jgi:hypothetical protein